MLLRLVRKFPPKMERGKLLWLEQTQDGIAGRYWFSDNVVQRHIFTDRELQCFYATINSLQCGDLLYIDISPDTCGGIVVPRVAETQAELEKVVGKLLSCEWVLRGIVRYGVLNRHTEWFE